VNYLKRSFIYIIVLSLLFTLTSCRENAKDTEPVSNSKQIEATSKESVSFRSAEDIYSLIPKGWQLLERVEGEPVRAEGDLNNDGINDIAIVVEEINKSLDEAAKRALIIAFGDGDNTYGFSVMAENAMLKVDEGGVWGDPIEGISVDRGSLLIDFYGGSNWRWYSTYRFRYQDNDWYLIGATLGSYFTGNTTMDNADEEDYNLLTGDFITKKADEKGNIITTKGNRGKRELIKLTDFNASSGKLQFL
jgi:hypothetical protein